MEGNDGVISFSIAYYISEWVIRLIMLEVVIRRRRPDSAMAWLLVIFFLPWPGLFAYWLIGENRLPRRRIERHKRLTRRFDSLRRQFDADPMIVHPEVAPELNSTIVLAERLGNFRILGGNRAALISRTEEFIERLIADIDSARDHAHLLFYIFQDDETGRRVAEALMRAADRGVTCRVLADAVGSRPFFRRLALRLRARGVRVIAELPVGVFRRRAARFDLRNHRKIAIIDGRVAYAGSQNIVDPDYGYKDLAWEDIMARIEGPVAQQLQAVFVNDWYCESGELLDSDTIFPAPGRVGDDAIQILPSGPNYEHENFQRLVVAALHSAQREVIMTTPYFVPDDPLLQAMQVAALRGVDLKLIVPARSDQRIAGAATRAYFEDLLAAGASVCLFERGLLHAKTMTVDSTLGFLGSSNFDIRSFALNFEISLVFYDPRLTMDLRMRQLEYLEASVPLSRERWRRRPLPKRLMENTAKLFSPLL